MAEPIDLPPGDAAGEPASFGPPSDFPPPGGADAGFGNPPFDASYPSDQPAFAGGGLPPIDPNNPFEMPAHIPAHKLAAEKPIITRLHMLEYVSRRDWWYSGQNNLAFTFILWFIFIGIMYSRAGVEESYDLHKSVEQHMENIVAHPHLSGVRVRAVKDNPMPCKCSCQSVTAGLPKGPCDTSSSETLDFLGHLPEDEPRLTNYNSQALLAAIPPIDPKNLGDKLDAGNDDIAKVTWSKIRKMEDVWFWVEHGFIPDVWAPRSQQANSTKLQGLVAQKNLIIGGMRARQKRAVWSADCEKKVDAAMSKFYYGDCRSEDDSSAYFGPSSGPDAANTSASAFRASTLKEGYYDAVFNVERPINESLHLAGFCRKYGWMDSAARSLVLQAVTLNAEVGMFALIYITFEFPPGGSVDAKVNVHTVRAMGSKINFGDIVPELAWAILIILLLRQEISQMCRAGYNRQCFDYWFDLWCVVDWISIFVGIAIAVFWLWQVSSIGAISDKVGGLPRSPFASGFNSADYETKWQKVLDDLDEIYMRKQYYQLCMFWYLMILTGRFLKNFLSQAKLAMLQLALGSAFWDATHLFFFFCMMFFNFVLGGHIMFGPETEAWSTMVNAGATSVKMLLGSYDFDEMYNIAPVSASLWFWGFLLSLAFILMNLLFAIIADYTHVIRESIGYTPTLWHDIKEASKDMYWRLQWRWLNVSDPEGEDLKERCKEYAEYCCVHPYTGTWSHPYNDLVEGLMQACEVPASLERDARHSCLGVKLGRRHMEALTVEGDTEDTNAGLVELTSKGLQEYGPDILSADHLLELIQPYVDEETARKNASQLTQIRHFVTLLRQHRAELDKHCADLENEVYTDHATLANHVDDLDQSVRGCLEAMQNVKHEGVHSLAPPAVSLPRPGTKAAMQLQQQSMIAPGGLLRAIQTHEQTKKMMRPPDSGPLAPSMNLAIADQSGSLLGNYNNQPANNLQALGYTAHPNDTIQAMLADNVMSTNSQPPSPPSGDQLRLRDAGAPDVGNDRQGPPAIMDQGNTPALESNAPESNAPPAIMNS